MVEFSLCSLIYNIDLTNFLLYLQCSEKELQSTIRHDPLNYSLSLVCFIYMPLNKLEFYDMILNQNCDVIFIFVVDSFC